MTITGVARYWKSTKRLSSFEKTQALGIRTLQITSNDNFNIYSESKTSDPYLMAIEDYEKNRLSEMKIERNFPDGSKISVPFKNHTKTFDVKASSNPRSRSPEKTQVRVGSSKSSRSLK